jgi:hypothetical protein
MHDELHFHIIRAIRFRGSVFRQGQAAYEDVTVCIYRTDEMQNNLGLILTHVNG